MKAIMIGGFIFVVLVLFYEIFFAEEYSEKLAFKCVNILFSYAALMVGVNSAANQTARRHSLAFYESRYGDKIKGAFSDDAASRKRLLKVLKYYNKDKLKKAEKLLLKLKRRCLKRSDFSAVLLFLALCYAEQGRSWDAVSEYEELLCYDSSNSTAWSNLGLLYAEQGRSVEAEAAYESALSADPDNAYAHNNLGQLYLELAEYDRAAEEYEAARRAGSALTAPLSGLAVCHAMRGDMEKSNEYARMYIGAGGDAEALKTAIESMLASAAKEP